MKTFEYDLSELGNGLRPTIRSAQNLPFLIKSLGVVPREGLLVALEQIAQLDTTSLPAQTFPFPQFFVLLNCTILCTQVAIYELVGSTLTPKIAGLTAGSTWSVVDYVDFLYFTNGKVVVTKDPQSLAYSLRTDLPVGTCLCDFGGQVIVGSPETLVPNGGLL